MSEINEPVLLPDSESAAVRALHEMMAGGEAALVSPSDERRQEIPDDVCQLFLRVLEHLERKEAIAIVPYRKELTTQAAADLLGVSRQHLVRLLESGEMPFHMVGAHRRVQLADLMQYRERRDRERRAAITAMALDAVEAGVYHTTIEPDD